MPLLPLEIQAYVAFHEARDVRVILNGSVPTPAFAANMSGLSLYSFKNRPIGMRSSTRSISHSC
jgi:hypothetical protein